MKYVIKTTDSSSLPSVDYDRLVLDTTSGKVGFKKASKYIYAKATINDTYLNLAQTIYGSNAVEWTPRKDIFSSFKVNGEELITEDTPYNKDYVVYVSEIEKALQNSLYSLSPIKGDYEIVAIVKDEVTVNRYFLELSPITEVTLPASITEFNDNFVGHCPNLTSIIYQGTMAQWNAIVKTYYQSGDDWNNNDQTITVTCTDGTIIVEPN